MKFFLKQNLPGIKAGTEMEKVVLSSGGEIDDGHIFQPGQVTEINGAIFEGVWKGKESDTWHRIPNSELSEWIEERTDGTWKPNLKESWFEPSLFNPKYPIHRVWLDDEYDHKSFNFGLVCPTPELATELADRMIETAKKFWEEKE